MEEWREGREVFIRRFDGPASSYYPSPHPISRDVRKRG